MLEHLNFISAMLGKIPRSGKVDGFPVGSQYTFILRRQFDLHAHAVGGVPNPMWVIEQHAGEGDHVGFT